MQPLSEQYEELKLLLKINKNTLDDDVETHPEYFRRVAEAHVLATSFEHEASDAVKHLHAAITMELRSTDEGKKMTEATLTAKVITDTRYKEAIALQIETRRMAQNFQALRESFNQRGYMLKELVQLYISGYWGNTSMNTPRSSMSTQKYEENKALIASVRGRTKLDA